MGIKQLIIDTAHFIFDDFYALRELVKRIMWKMLGNLRRNALGNIFSVLPRVIGENSNFGNMRLRRSTETKCEVSILLERG